MVLGLGIDLVELARVERALEQWKDRLVAKLMDPAEAARLPAKGPARARAVAFAIAGKEAVSKALGTGWAQGVFWRDVEVFLGPEPGVILHGHAAEVARDLGSDGSLDLALEVQGELILGEARLLA